jgi:hypothetical protein
MLLGKDFVMQGGVRNYLGETEEVNNAPRYWKSSPTSPKTELSYITDAEKKLLLDANLHGSLIGGKPNIGAAGLLSFDGWGDASDGFGGGGSGGGSSGGGSGGGGGGGRQDAQSQYGGGSYDSSQNVSTREQVYGGGGDSGDTREQYAVARTTTPIGIPVNVPSISPVERDTGLERARQINIDLANALRDRPFETIKTPSFLANILGNFIGNFAYPINKDFFQENIAGKKGYGYGYEDFSQYMTDRSLGKVDAYGNPISQEREGSGSDRDAITNIVSQAPYLISGSTPQQSMVNQYFANMGSMGQPLSSSLQTSYNNAKNTINNLLGITPPSQQFGGLMSSNLASNPFNIDYLTQRGLI